MRRKKLRDSRGKNTKTSTAFESQLKYNIRMKTCKYTIYFLKTNVQELDMGSSGKVLDYLRTSFHQDLSSPIFAVHFICCALIFTY